MPTMRRPKSPTFCVLVFRGAQSYPPSKQRVRRVEHERDRVPDRCDIVDFAFRCTAFTVRSTKTGYVVRVWYRWEIELRTTK